MNVVWTILALVSVVAMTALGVRNCSHSYQCVKRGGVPVQGVWFRVVCLRDTR